MCRYSHLYTSLQQLGSELCLPDSCPYIPVSPVAPTRTQEPSAQLVVQSIPHTGTAGWDSPGPQQPAETSQPTGVPCPGQQLLPVPRSSGVHSSGWVPCLATRAETPLGQPWERPSGQSVPSSEILTQVPTCLCAPRLLWLIRKAFDGSWNGNSWVQGILWAPLPTVVPLCSSVSVQMSF